MIKNGKTQRINEIWKIKNQILKIDSKRWWGDDFDVRFYLISKLKKIQEKKVLDIGGGIGIISSQTDKNNFRINMDILINDLKKSQENFPRIHHICASMTHLPFTKETIDIIICSNILEVAKSIDLQNKSEIQKENVYEFPTIENTLSQIVKILKNTGILYITTPNNEYYKGEKLTYDELKKCLSNYFKKYEMYFFNTYFITSKKYKKFNITNIIPKIKARIIEPEKVLVSLIKRDLGNHKKSVSFFVEARKL